MRKLVKKLPDACLLALLVFSLFLFPPLGRAIAFAQEFARSGLAVKGNKIIVELADTPLKRSAGLMHRTALEEDSGMLFIFKVPKVLGFWMKNTKIPLSIAFADQSGVILNIEDMKPGDLTATESKGEASFALEMNKGWFLKHKVKAGDKLEGLDKLSIRN
ncbi:MAG: DUF192 domain-containing protein [Candidatus Firestonebacteria bacterium]